jgi:hypothetical protein
MNHETRFIIIWSLIKTAIIATGVLLATAATSKAAIDLIDSLTDESKWSAEVRCNGEFWTADRLNATDKRADRVLSQWKAFLPACKLRHTFQRKR